MQLISVNIGTEQPLDNGKTTGTSGIFKLPTTESIRITRDGIVNDIIMDKQNHGGVDQALYVYGSPDYAWWSTELGRELLPGIFGENLTISDLESAALNIGDRLRVGEALIEVTSPRIPCATLAARMGDPKFVKRFRFAERPGVYCRVIETGSVRAGDAVSLEPYHGETITVIELMRLFYQRDADEAALLRMLAAPIAIRARVDTEERLAKVRAKASNVFLNRQGAKVAK